MGVVSGADGSILSNSFSVNLSSADLSNHGSFGGIITCETGISYKPIKEKYVQFVANYYVAQQ